MLVPLEFTPDVSSKQLVPCTYRGFIQVTGVEHEICILLPRDGSGKLSEADVRVGASLRRLVLGSEHVVQSRLRSSSSVQQFLVELSDVLERLARVRNQAPAAATAAAAAAAISPAFYSRLMADLDELGWHRVVDLDQSLLSLRMRVVDAARREHVVHVQLSPQYPLVAPHCTAELPEAVAVAWQGRTSTLAGVYGQYERAVARQQGLWEALEDLDKHTHVLEGRGSAERRVAAGAGLSVSVRLPPDGRAVPQLRLLGPDALTQPLLARLNARLPLWDPALLPRLNLQRLLQLEFPHPSQTRREQFLVGCAICYEYHFTDHSVPEKVCENASCRRQYHVACLLSCLKAAATSVASGGTWLGRCPYCTHYITVSALASTAAVQ